MMNMGIVFFSPKSIAILTVSFLFTNNQAGLTLLLWCIGLPIIMNPKDSIAVSYTQVVNANLYFGSWTAFFCILWISANLAKLLYGVDIAARASPLIKSRRGKWYALVAASIVVMCSSIRVFKAFQCSTDEMLKAPTCKQTKYAISAGVLGTVESALCTLWQANYGIGRVHERVAAFLMVIIWALGLIFITFGEGPGHSIGNLYFATWASFILSVLIFAECLNEYLGVQQQASDPSSELPPHETTIEDLSMDIGVVENVDL